MLDAPAPPLGEWTHLATTYDGATLRLYENGIERASTASPGNISDDPPIFGVCSGGAMDELAFYDKALSADRLAAHVAAIRGK